MARRRQRTPNLSDHRQFLWEDTAEAGMRLWGQLHYEMRALGMEIDTQSVVIDVHGHIRDGDADHEQLEEALARIEELEGRLEELEDADGRADRAEAEAELLREGIDDEETTRHVINLRAFMARRGANAPEMSRLLRVAPCTIYNWLEGNTTPNASNLSKIARLINRAA